MMYKPKFVVGDKVARPIYFRGDLAHAVSYRIGTIQAVHPQTTWSGFTYYKYDILWDDATTPSCHYSEVDLLHPEDIPQS